MARGWGKPRSSAPRRSRSSGEPVHRRAASSVSEGDVISIDGTTGEVVLGEVALIAAEPPAEFDTILGWADQVRKGKLGVRTNADTGDDAANAREFGAEGIGLCRTEHMFLRRPPADRAAHDPRRHARGGGRPRSRSCARGRRPTSSRSSRRWTACRSPCACSTRRCTSSCPTSRSCASSRPRDGLDRPRSTSCSQAAEAVAGVQPDARHPRRAPRRPQARPLRACRCGRSWRRPSRCASRRRQPDRRDHDPAHRHPRGAGAARGWVRGRDRRGVAGPDEASPTITHRHDDRDAARRAAAPTRSPRWPTSSRSAPTTSPR